MRRSTPRSAWTALVLAAACSGGGRPRQEPAAAPPYVYPYAAQPYPYGPGTPAPSAYAAPYPAAPPLPYPLAQMARVEGQQRNTVRAAPIVVPFNVPAQINLAAMAVVRQLFPKGCAPFEAVHGSLVRLDCRRYARIASAKVVNPADKLRLFRAGQLRLDPQVLGAVAPPLLLTGLQSLLVPSSPAPVPNQEIPAAVDHRAQGTEGPIKDQQLVGACTAFSLSSVMDNAVRRLNKADVISAMHIWSRYADATMPSAGSRNEGHPLALWADFPYDERAACRMEQQDDGCAELLVPPVRVDSAGSDPDIQGEIHTADARGRYTIAEIDQIDPIDPNVLAFNLATGKDVWIAMGVSQDAWTSPGVQATGVVPDWIVEDGGHAVVLAGYRPSTTGRQFLVHNSWGLGWGDHGYGWVSDAMVKAHGQYAYTVKVVDQSAAVPPPTPVPVPQPSGQKSCPAGFTMPPGVGLCQKTCAVSSDCGGGAACVHASQPPAPAVCVATNPLTDDDCGAAELIDMVTGQCAPACANGGRSAAGLCLPLSLP